MADAGTKWMEDGASGICLGCKTAFGMFNRRHHCRSCGKLFCSSCTQNTSTKVRGFRGKKVRVCQECSQRIAFSSKRRLTQVSFRDDVSLSGYESVDLNMDDRRDSFINSPSSWEQVSGDLNFSPEQSKQDEQNYETDLQSLPVSAPSQPLPKRPSSFSERVIAKASNASCETQQLSASSSETEKGNQNKSQEAQRSSSFVQRNRNQITLAVILALFFIYKRILKR